MIDRDVVTELVDRVQVRGLGYMLLLYMLNSATVSELCLMTREDRHTVSDCLRELEMRQYVVRIQSGRSEKWFPSQTGLSFMRSVVGGNPTNNGPTTTTAILPPLNSAKAVVAASVVGGNPTNNGPTTTAILPSLDSAKAVVATAAESEGEKITLKGEKITLSPPTTTTATLPSLDSAKAVVAAESEGEKITLTAPAIDAKLAAAFKAAGIGSNAWPGLAKLAHVTPALVKAHDAYRREHGESTGLLITRLRCGDPVPKKAGKPVRNVAAEWQKVIDEQRGGKRRKR